MENLGFWIIGLICLAMCIIVVCWAFPILWEFITDIIDERRCKRRAIAKLNAFPIPYPIGKTKQGKWIYDDRDFCDFRNLLFKPHPAGGQHACIKFSNGYGISVIKGDRVYLDDGEYEVAILHGSGFCTNQRILDKVVGEGADCCTYPLDKTQVEEIMWRLQALPTLLLEE